MFKIRNPFFVIVLGYTQQWSCHTPSPLTFWYVTEVLGTISGTMNETFVNHVNEKQPFYYFCGPNINKYFNLLYFKK